MATSEYMHSHITNVQIYETDLAGLVIITVLHCVVHTPNNKGYWKFQAGGTSLKAATIFLTITHC